ncbi:hypothetical protein ACWDY4_32100 [Streptomyces olivaceoviridis]
MERVTPAVRDAVRQTITVRRPCPQSARPPTTPPRRGRRPTAAARTRRAYSEAIKAVECAAHAVIQPTNAKATLEIRNARHKFSAAIPSPAGDPIAPAEAMMRALWEGQTSRHGAQTATVPEPLDAARAGVHLAAALPRAARPDARTP